MPPRNVQPMLIPSPQSTSSPNVPIQQQFINNSQNTQQSNTMFMDEQDAEIYHQVIFHS